MKKGHLVALIGCAAGILLPQLARTQGVVTYLNNTNQPVIGSTAINPGFDFQIRTGTNAGGYLLNSLQLLFTSAVGNPDYSPYLFIYIRSGPSAFVGNIIADLVTTYDPMSAGLYTFTPFQPGPPAILAGNTNYWLLIGATALSSFGNYQALYTDTTAATANDGWLITSAGLQGTGIPIFSINATAVPEPSIWALLVLALAISNLTRKTDCRPGKILK